MNFLLDISFDFSAFTVTCDLWARFVQINWWWMHITTQLSSFIKTTRTWNNNYAFLCLLIRAGGCLYCTSNPNFRFSRTLWFSCIMITVFSFVNSLFPFTFWAFVKWSLPFSSQSNKGLLRDRMSSLQFVIVKLF